MVCIEFFNQNDNFRWLNPNSLSILVLSGGLIRIPEHTKSADPEARKMKDTDTEEELIEAFKAWKPSGAFALWCLVFHLKFSLRNGTALNFKLLWLP